jgi:hypothetical protein
MKERQAGGHMQSHTNEMKGVSSRNQRRLAKKEPKILEVRNGRKSIIEKFVGALKNFSSR